MAIIERFKNGWNAFFGRDPTDIYSINELSYGSSYRPDRTRLVNGGARSIVSAIYNKIAVDASMVKINHARLNEEGNYVETIQDSLNYCLTTSANLDQTGRNLIKDAVLSMFDEGCVALVPTLTDVNPKTTDSFKIGKIRTGKILQWYPDKVRLLVYNEKTGEKEEIVLPKRIVAIVENPFYAVMNEPNSVAQRLIRTLAQLDSVNDDISSGKLDLIVQLPYQIRSTLKEIQAKKRRKELETQLKDSKYGIAYIDGTEKVIQLNRSLENNLWEQAKDLQTQLFNQLGFAQAVFDGTADEATMLNYYNSTINPIMTALTEEMQRKWLSITAQSQGQAIVYFSDAFKLIPISQLAELGDKMTRNEIMTSNEMRSKMGMKASDDPKADQLVNSNLNQSDEKVEEKITVDKESENS